MAARLPADSPPRRHRARPVAASLVIAVLLALCCVVIGVTRDVVRPWPGGTLYGALVGTWLLVQLALCHLEWRRQQRFPECHRGDAVTVVIPTYNEPPSILRDCVSSALNQAYAGPIEVVVVDDGSDCPQPDMADLLRSCPPRRSLYCQRLPQNQGKRHAQAAGFRMAQGEFVATVDSDTRLDSRAIDRALVQFSDGEVGAVTGVALVGNRDTLLTRLIHLRYWNAFCQELPPTNGQGASQAGARASLCDSALRQAPYAAGRIWSTIGRPARHTGSFFDVQARQTGPSVLSHWKTTTRYYPFSRFLRETFGCDVRRIAVNGGFGCPNRDGAIGVGGCTFCVNPSFSPVAGDQAPSIRQQVLSAIGQARGRGFDGRFLVYFQPFTNTHAEVDTLHRRYDEALCDEGIVGLAIGTRPDCVPNHVLDLVQSYTDRCQVWLEYGIQSCHDATLDRINRGHTWEAVVDAVERTRGRGILICVHAILGLPGETREHMRQTAERVAGLGIDGIKLRQLAIVKGAQMEAEHERGEVATLTGEEYVSLIADFLERLPESIVVQRLVGDTRSDLLLAPKWEESKSQVLSAITNELRRRGTWQGSLFAG